MLDNWITLFKLSELFTHDEAKFSVPVRRTNNNNNNNLYFKRVTPITMKYSP